MWFVRFKGKGQERYLRSIKEKEGLTWDKLAEKFGAKRSTFFRYVQGSLDLPLNLFRRLSRTNHIEEEAYILIKKRGTKKEIRKPLMSKRLAYFLGILAGDGHMGKNQQCLVSVVCHRWNDRNVIEEEYKQLLKDLFDLEGKVREKDNLIECRVYSKELVDHLHKKHGLPRGKKKGNLKIPRGVYEKKSYMKHYISGLFDTDGSFHKHHARTAAVEIISLDSRFLHEVKSALERMLGLKSSISGKSLYVYSKKDIDRFFEKIQPKNRKHIIKYHKFKKEGFVPSSAEILQLMRRSSNG